MLLALCLLCAGVAGAIDRFRPRIPAASQPAVEYVLDASPRMALPAEGGTGTRLQVAEGILSEIVRPSSPVVAAGLRVFGTGHLPAACADTDLLVPLAPAAQGQISARLPAVSAGSQPDAAMAAAVVAALRDLAAAAGPRTLIVVTGGSDSCNAQASQLIAAEAQKLGIDYQLFVVGYQVPDGTGSAVLGLVDGLSNGHYVNARTPDELRTILAAIQQYVDNPQTNSVSGVLATAAALPTPGPATPLGLSTASPTPLPTGTASSLSANPPSATPDQAPRVVSFLARFDPVKRSTFYSVTVTSETLSVSVPTVSYAWSITNKCGNFIATDSPFAEWHHPDVSGSCPNEPVHRAVITVVISNQYGALRCDYAGGSAPGDVVQCQSVHK